MRTILTGAIRRIMSPNVGAPLRRVHHNRSPILSLGTEPYPKAQAMACRTLDYFGPGSIAGIVSIEDVPARRLVRLFDAVTGHLVASVYSGNDGRYRFAQLNLARDYIVLATDFTRQVNAVVADAVRAVPVP